MYEEQTDEQTMLLGKEQHGSRESDSDIERATTPEPQPMSQPVSQSESQPELQSEFMSESPSESQLSQSEQKKDPVEHTNNDNNNVMNHGIFLQIRVCLMEPMIMLLVFGYMLSTTVLKNQILYQTCRAIFHFSINECKSLDNKTKTNKTAEIEVLVQSYASHIFITLDVVQAIVPALFGCFVGVWADRFGRKPLLVTAFTGYGLSYLVMSIISQMASQYNVSPWYYIISILPTVLTGGAVTYSVAAVCYISDVATDTAKPYRMILYEAAMWVGLLLGSFSSGYLFEFSGAIVVFRTSAAIILAAAFIIAVFMPESLHFRRPVRLQTNPTAEVSKTPPTASTVPTASTTPTASQAQTAQTAPTSQQKLFDFAMLKMNWQCGFQERVFNDRAIIWLTISTMLITTFISDGAGGVFYMFVRQQFKWTLRQYTNYDTLNMSMLIVGNLLGIWLLRKLLKLSLVTVAIIAFLSNTISCVMKTFAFVDWQLYVAATIGMFKAISNPMCRTVLTNIVPRSELGKILSIFGVLQSLMSLVASPFYMFLYSITLTTFAGFFNLLSAHLCILAMILLYSIFSKAQINSIHYETILN